jgi:hypothetical protein
MTSLEIKVSLQMKDRSKNKLLAPLRTDFGSLSGMNVLLDPELVTHHLSVLTGN